VIFIETIVEIKIVSKGGTQSVPMAIGMYRRVKLDKSNQYSVFSI